MDIYEAKVWRTGCSYLVAKPNDFCNKCGQQHNEDARESGHPLFSKGNDDDGSSK